MRQPIQFSDQDLKTLLQLRLSGFSYRQLAKHFGVSHMTIKRVYHRLTTTPCLFTPINCRLNRDISFRFHHLAKGEIVQIPNPTYCDPRTNTALVTSHHYPSICLDVPIDALEVLRKK